MTGGLAWQPPQPGRCWACAVVVAPVGEPDTVYACAACIADPPRPHPLRVLDQAEPVGWVHLPPGATRQQMAEVASGLQYLAARHGTQGGNTTFHAGGVIHGPGGTGTNTARVLCGLCGARWLPDLTIGGCPCCHGDERTAGAVRALHYVAMRRHACCGGMADRGHTTSCPEYGIWMETETARPAWPVIKMPRLAAKARPQRSLARLAGSVGDSASWGLLATWVGWLVIPGIGYVHAVHLSLIILAAAATILTVAGMCGYGRNSRED